MGDLITTDNQIGTQSDFFSEQENISLNSIF